MGSCNCGTAWKGSRLEHCPSCHRTFSGTTAGDKHRTGDHAVLHGPNRRRCRTAAEMLEVGLAPRTTPSGLEVWGKEAPEGRSWLSGYESDGLSGAPEGIRLEAGFRALAKWRHREQSLVHL